MPLKIGINGFGRIGRLVLRSLIEKPRKTIEVKLINSPSELSTQIHLLKFDSTHRNIENKIKTGENWIDFGRGKINFLHEKDPKLINYKKYNIDLVMECSGKFNNKKYAENHLKSGAKKVLFSAPVKNADITSVFGVNHKDILLRHKIISNASCTTNALAPIIKVLDQKLGIINGNMTTIHSITNDQNILDNSHKDLRRARAAFSSIVPTSTGAAKSIGLVLPKLKNKIDGSALRVPTPNVSLIDFHFNSRTKSTVKEINDILRSASKKSMKGIMSTNDLPLVSIDFNHNSSSVIADLTQTQVQDETLIRVVGWYDNEWGFANRMLDIAEYIQKNNLI